MKTTPLHTCGNSPKSALAQELFISIVTQKHSELATYLEDEIELINPEGKRELVAKEDLSFFNFKPNKNSNLQVLNVVIHGKSAAANGVVALTKTKNIYLAIFLEFSSTTFKRIKRIHLYQSSH